MALRQPAIRVDFLDESRNEEYFGATDFGVTVAHAMPSLSGGEPAQRRKLHEVQHTVANR
jgi:hypothetical protein